MRQPIPAATTTDVNGWVRIDRSTAISMFTRSGAPQFEVSGGRVTQTAYSFACLRAGFVSRFVQAIPRASSATSTNALSLFSPPFCLCGLLQSVHQVSLVSNRRRSTMSRITRSSVRPSHRCLGWHDQSSLVIVPMSDAVPDTSETVTSLTMLMVITPHVLCQSGTLCDIDQV